VHARHRLHNLPHRDAYTRSDIKSRARFAIGHIPERKPVGTDYIRNVDVVPDRRGVGGRVIRPEAGQGPGPLRHALPPSAPRPPGVRTHPVPHDLALPRSHGPAPHSRKCQSRLPPGPATRPDHQARLPLFAAAHLCDPPAEAGDDIRAIQTLLGHQSLRPTPRRGTPTSPPPISGTPRVRSISCQTWRAWSRPPRSDWRKRTRAPGRPPGTGRHRAAHAGQLTRLSGTQAITECRTVALAGHRRVRPVWPSRDLQLLSGSALPKCQDLEAARWMDAQLLSGADRSCALYSRSICRLTTAVRAHIIPLTV
jgi:hypothetical protein